MKKLVISAFLTSVWSVVMIVTLQWIVRYEQPHRFHQDVDSPILAAELSASAADFDNVLEGIPANPANRAGAARAIEVNTILDLVYIVFYVAYLRVLTRLAGSQFARLTKVVLFAALAAGIADYVEDAFIFSSLGGAFLPVLIPSLIKWSLLALTLIGIGRMLVSSVGTLYSLQTDRLLGVAHIGGGVVILMGVVFGRWYGYSAIAAGVSIFALSVLVIVLYPLTVWLLRLFPEREVKYVEDFCKRRSRGEITGPAVQAVSSNSDAH